MKKRKTHLAPDLTIKKHIFVIRNQKVILDYDLAKLYRVSTKRLNEQVKRNRKRFPSDFVFQLTQREKMEVVANCDHLKPLKFSPQLPYAFTEQGAIMAANILQSQYAVQMSVFVVRAFVKMRSFLSDHRELASSLKALEEKLTSRLDTHEIAIVDVLRKLIKLMEPPAPEPEIKKPKIGFTAH